MQVLKSGTKRGDRIEVKKSSFEKSAAGISSKHAVEMSEAYIAERSPASAFRRAYSKISPNIAPESLASWPEARAALGKHIVRAAREYSIE